MFKSRLSPAPENSQHFSSDQQRRLNVCFIGCYPPTRGRLAEYSYYLVEELHRLPQIGSIEIVADAAEHHTTNRINKKITLHRVWKINRPTSLLAVPFVILKLRPDVVQFNVHMAVFGRSRLANFIGLSLPLICRMMGFKTLVNLHNITEAIDVEKAGFKNSFTNRLGAFAAVKLLTFASVITLTVKSYLGILKGRYRCKKAVWIPHGTWKTELNGRSNHLNPKTFLYIGHSGPYKDLKLLFESFTRLNQRRKGVRLIIAGASHPNYPGFLEKYAKNGSRSINFIGYVPEDRLVSLFEKVAAVILPYHTCTGTSGVAHLASSFGVPIIATDLPEFRELLEEGCGIILSPHDPESLADRMEQVIDDSDLSRRLMEQNLLFAQERTWDKVAGSFCKVYSQI